MPAFGLIDDVRFLHSEPTHEEGIDKKEIYYIFVEDSNTKVLTDVKNIYETMR